MELEHHRYVSFKLQSNLNVANSLITKLLPLHACKFSKKKVRVALRVEYKYITKVMPTAKNLSNPRSLRHDLFERL